MDDAELVLALRAGERSALAEMYDRYAPRLHGYCTRILNEPQSADDAVQDTFVLAAARIDQLRDPSRLRPWLYAIARNECTRTGRARARAVPVDDLESVSSVSTDDDESARGAEATDHAELVWAAADGLDDGDRALLELSVRHGLEGAELAAASGVAPGQISMATGRMRDRLERSLGALLVARQGRRDCAGLAQVLVDWDGTFTVLWRKRVARHVDACDRCSRSRSVLVAPLGTLGLVPAVAVFTMPGPGLRDRTLRSMEAIASRRPVPTDRSLPGLTEPWPDGFPPALPVDDDDEPAPVTAHHHRRRRLALVLGVLLLVAGVTAFFVASAGSGDTREAVPEEIVTRSPISVAGPLVSSPSSVSSTTRIAPEPSDPVTTAAPTTVAITDTDVTSTDVPITEAPVTTTSVALSPATVPPTTEPVIAANRPPAASGLGLTQAGPMSTCNGGDTRTVTVTVDDDRGVADVILRWRAPDQSSGRKVMSRQGSQWFATLGPFPTSGTATFEAIATDTDGLVTTAGPQSVTVQPCGPF